jgi:hypothetical protein
LPINFRYSAISRDARAVGVRLLELTRPYENLVVPAGLGVTKLAVLTLVARARNLLRVTHYLADTGDGSAAALSVRAITESVLTLGWFNRDPELAEAVWMLDELRSRLSHHEEVAKEERRQRARARRAGEPVAALAPGQSLGLLPRSRVREYRKLQAKERARVKNLPRVARRKKRLRVERIAKMPGFGDRAKVADMPWVYSFAYRFDSNSAAHPTSMALEQFLEVTPEGIRILPTASGARADPYYVAAALMSALLELAEDHVDHAEIEAGLTEIRAEIERLRELGLD